MKVLWLASWYPNVLEPFNGDFIQRHAEAASLYHDIEVIALVKDEKGSETRDIKQVIRKRGRLTERIIYYHSPVRLFPLAGRFFSRWKYWLCYKRSIKEYLNREGMPALVHVQVSMKAGMLALWLKRRYKLPFLLTEHSSLFLPEADLRITGFPGYYQSLCRKVLAQAGDISVVSDYLGKNLSRFGGLKSYRVIPNVVDTGQFHPVSRKAGPVFRFIHVSGLGYSKNPEALLAAFSLLRESCQNFILDIYGVDSSWGKDRTHQFGLDPFVRFHGEVPHEEIARRMQESDALVLYSRFETFGCVVIEANACGLPVVVSDYPTLREHVTDRFNGLVVKNGEPAALAGALLALVRGEVKFDPGSIAAYAHKHFGYEQVGWMFRDWYNQYADTRIGSTGT